MVLTTSPVANKNIEVVANFVITAVYSISWQVAVEQRQIWHIGFLDMRMSSVTRSSLSILPWLHLFGRFCCTHLHQIACLRRCSSFRVASSSAGGSGEDDKNLHLDASPQPITTVFYLSPWKESNIKPGCKWSIFDESVNCGLLRFLNPTY